MQERIKELRKTLGMSQEDFAKKLGLKSRGKIANIEFGKIEAEEDFVKLICKTYNVNYQWLTNGTGKMFKDDDSDAQAIVDAIMTGDNEFAKKLIVSLAKLDEDKWEMIKEFIEEIARE